MALWMLNKDYNAQAAADFANQSDPLQPARDAIQFARDNAGPWQPAQWANNALDFAKNTAAGLGGQDAMAASDAAQPAPVTPEPAPVQAPQPEPQAPPAQPEQPADPWMQPTPSHVPTQPETPAPATSVPTTADISNPTQHGDSPSIGLGDIYRIAMEQGLGEDGARVAVAIAQTEGGLNGAAGDGGKSRGPFQFYGDVNNPGQLNNYAKQLGMSIQQAGDYVSQHPGDAAAWALQAGGYLGDAIRRGAQKNLTGAELATYAQNPSKYHDWGDPGGQVSVSPERAGANYQALFGGAVQPVLSSVGDFLGNAGQAIGNAWDRVGSAVATAATTPGPALQDVGNLAGTAWQTAQDVGNVVAGQSGSIIADLPHFNQQQDPRAPFPGQSDADIARLRAAYVQNQTAFMVNNGMDPITAAQAAEKNAQETIDNRTTELKAPWAGGIGTYAPTNEQTLLGGGNYSKAVESGTKYNEQNPVGAGVAGILSPAAFPEKVIAGVRAGQQIGDLGMGAALAIGSLKTLKAGEAAKAGQIGQTIEAPRLVDAAGNLLGRRTKVETALDGLVVPGQAAPAASQIVSPTGDLLSTMAPKGAVLRTASSVEAAPVAISPETLRRLPNLTKIDAPRDVIDTLARTAQDNPALFDKFQQGVVTHDELVGDLAPRLGMTASDFLKTKVGQAFNPEELLTLRATVVDKTQSLAAMAQSINAQGGIGALSDAGKADAMRNLVEAARLQAVARGGASTAGRTLGQQKIVLDTQLARQIVGANEAKAADKALAAAQATQARLQARTAELQKLQAGNALKAGQQAELDRIGKEAVAAKQEEATALLRRQAARDKVSKTTQTQQESARKALDALGGRDVTEEILKQFLQLQEADDPLATAKFLKGMAQPTMWGRIGVLRYGSMLSATSSHLANATGNAIMTGVDLAVKPVAAGIDATRAAITGGPRTRYMAEAWPEAQGLAEGAITGARDAWTVIKTGINPAGVGKVETTAIRAGFGVNPVVDFAAELPMRLMEAGDLIFRGAATAGNFRVLAMRQAIGEGYKGTAAAGRVQEIVGNATDFPELLGQAQKLGARIVVQEKRGVTNYLAGARRVPGLNYVTDVMLPFVKTPYNIAAQGVGMTPVGFFGVLNDIRKGNPGAAADTAARAFMGTAVMGVSTSLAAQGFLTGAYPTDPQEISALPQGFQPWSVRLPHADGSATYIPYQNLGPVGIPMAIAALIGTDWAKGKAAWTPEYGGKVVASVGKYMSDQTFLRGIGDLLKAINEPDRYAENLVEGLATQVVPYAALQRQLTRALDVGTRDPHSALEAVLALNPITASQVPAKQDVFGQPVKPAQTGIGAFISPVRYDVAQPNPVLDEYRRLQGAGFNVGIAKPPAKISKVALTGDEQRQLQTTTGDTLQPLLDKVIANRAYQQLSDQDKATVLDRLESQVRATAAEAMAQQMGRGFLLRYQAAASQ